MTVLATVIFADISGSVALYESLGNERAAEAVAQLTDWIGTCIHSHAGRVVKKLGDGVLGVFGDAASATAASSAMLRAHEQRQARWPHPIRMDIRVGMATGDIVEVDGDCYGDAVNVAARLCERSGPGEIWATETLVLPPMARSNSPTLGHPKFPQAGPPDYDDSGATAMRAAASLRR